MSQNSSQFYNIVDVSITILLFFHNIVDYIAILAKAGVVCIQHLNAPICFVYLSPKLYF